MLLLLNDSRRVRGGDDDVRQVTRVIVGADRIYSGGRARVITRVDVYGGAAASAAAAGVRDVDAIDGVVVADGVVLDVVRTDGVTGVRKGFPDMRGGGGRGGAVVKNRFRGNGPAVVMMMMMMLLLLLLMMMRDEFRRCDGDKF